MCSELMSSSTVAVDLGECIATVHSMQEISLHFDYIPLCQAYASEQEGLRLKRKIIRLLCLGHTIYFYSTPYVVILRLLVEFSHGQ